MEIWQCVFTASSLEGLGMAGKIGVAAKGVPPALVMEMVKRINWPWGEISEQLTRILRSLYQQKQSRVDDLQAEDSHIHTHSPFPSQFPDLNQLSHLEPSG